MLPHHFSLTNIKKQNKYMFKLSCKRLTRYGCSECSIRLERKLQDTYRKTFKYKEILSPKPFIHFWDLLARSSKCWSLRQPTHGWGSDMCASLSPQHSGGLAKAIRWLPPSAQVQTKRQQHGPLDCKSREKAALTWLLYHREQFTASFIVQWI